MTTEESVIEDYYAARLAGISEAQDRHLVALEDIYNAHGIKLLAKGSSLNHERLMTVARNKLLKPLHDIVGMSGGVDTSQLQIGIERIVASRPDTSQLHQLLGVEEVLKECCEYVGGIPIVMQKLTVLADTDWAGWDRSLLAAWLALLVTRQMPRLPDRIEHVFLATLAHDIGFLHMRPELMNDIPAPGTSEWKMREAHPVLGHEILRHVVGDSPLPAEAVLQHHEQMQGVGYPRGISDPSWAAQVVGLMTYLSELKQGYYNGEVCTLQNLRPALEFVRDGYRTDLVAAVRETLNMAPPAVRATKDEDMPALLHQVLSEQDALRERFAHLSEQVHPSSPARLRALQQHLHFMTASTGVISPEYRRWMEFVATNALEVAYQEVEDVSLHLRTVKLLLGRLEHLLMDV